ncbi:hypothetical protein Fcan01_10952 [Folsomia candida]|uniref:Uncharacterized protein n=1 Tax=Folsomia candida TaxID=158441 RepID=A0A226E7D2_FOLCA|nr:hypothetical protein Fcan01_10952 [Folsomia candida]
MYKIQIVPSLNRFITEVCREGYKNSDFLLENYQIIRKSMKVFALLVILVALFIGLTTSQKHGASCTHTGIKPKDDSVCSGNLLCGISNTCVCPDTYGSSPLNFNIAADGLSCVERS